MVSLFPHYVHAGAALSANTAQARTNGRRRSRGRHSRITARPHSRDGLPEDSRSSLSRVNIVRRARLAGTSFQIMPGQELGSALIVVGDVMGKGLQAGDAGCGDRWERSVPQHNTTRIALILMNNLNDQDYPGSCWGNRHVPDTSD